MGRTIGLLFPGPFLVARDTRTQSKGFQQALIAGLRTTRRPVTSLGILPTPAISFAAERHHLYGMEVSPSHNPIGYTGLKIFGPSGRVFTREWKTVRSAFVSDRPPTRRGAGPPGARRPGPIGQAGLSKEYLSFVTAGLSSEIRMVADCRGGATADLGPRALRSLGVDLRLQRAKFASEPGRFSPEPERGHLDELSSEVMSTGADLGVTFDGDGDRVMFVDRAGRMVEPEVVAMILYDRIGSRDHPLVASLDCASRLEELVPTFRCAVGSRFVVTAMAQQRSPVGVEASSHYYLRKFGPNSDGILIACQLAHILSSERDILERYSERLGPVARGSVTWDFPGQKELVQAFEAVESLAKPMARQEIDGFSISTADGRCLFRRSNTQPTLRAMLEAKDADAMERLARAVRKLVSEASPRPSRE
jgi:phosphoglucosamine mutase